MGKDVWLTWEGEIWGSGRGEAYDDKREAETTKGKKASMNMYLREEGWKEDNWRGYLIILTA